MIDTGFLVAKALIGKIRCIMKILSGKRILGFTLIELMVVIAILAILVGLAYPSYVDYVRKSKRAEAQQLLMNWSINQEIWRSNNPQYATTAQLPSPGHTYYDFSIPTRTGVAYTLRAAAKDDQVNDKAKDGTGCSPLTINQSGQKSPATCWD